MPPPENPFSVRVITIVISLIAAGSGLVALLNYFHRPTEPPEPDGTPVLLSVSFAPNTFKGPGSTMIVTIAAKSTYDRPIRDGDVIIEAKCTFAQGELLKGGKVDVKTNAGSGIFQPKGENLNGITRLVAKTNSNGIFTARWLYPELSKQELSERIWVLSCKFNITVNKQGYTGAADEKILFVGL